MPLVISKAIVRKTAKPKQNTRPIWERGVEDILENIDKSRVEANGRYVQRQPDPKSYASKCWKIFRSKKYKGVQDEEVLVMVKCAGRNLKVLTSETQGERASEIKIHNSELLSTIDAVREFLMSLDAGSKTSKDRKEWHEEMKLAYKPKNHHPHFKSVDHEWEYNKSKDIWQYTSTAKEYHAKEEERLEKAAAKQAKEAEKA
jgi:hypothetical protein